jgi:hypothetical protein
MDFQNISIDETQAAALRGHSVDTQRRHRRQGIGPKAFKAGSKGWRYWLRDIKAEQDERDDATAMTAA